MTILSLPDWHFPSLSRLLGDFPSNPAIGSAWFWCWWVVLELVFKTMPTLPAKSQLFWWPSTMQFEPLIADLGQKAAICEIMNANPWPTFHELQFWHIYCLCYVTMKNTIVWEDTRSLTCTSRHYPPGRGGPTSKSWIEYTPGIILERWSWFWY